LPGEIKYFFLDLFCYAGFSERRRNDQTAVGYKFAMAPFFDITKANPYLSVVKAMTRFALNHFFNDVGNATFSNTGAAALADSSISLVMVSAKSASPLLAIRTIIFLILFHLCLNYKG
jgi:hypothetical protein